MNYVLCCLDWVMSVCLYSTADAEVHKKLWQIILFHNLSIKMNVNKSLLCM